MRSISHLSVQLRDELEREMGMDLAQYRHFIADSMMEVFGQMQSPSLILPYLYLGSEWNASNIDELKANRSVTVRHSGYSRTPLWVLQ